MDSTRDVLRLLGTRVKRLPNDDRHSFLQLVSRVCEGLPEQEETKVLDLMALLLKRSPSRELRVMMFSSTELENGVSARAVYCAQTIRRIRAARSLTQYDLAERVGIPQSHVSKIETARLEPTRKTLERIADALNVSVEELDPTAEIAELR